MIEPMLDASGPCRCCATAVSCRAASRTRRRACPCPVLLCTLHIGGANLKSRATCDSPVPPRSPTDVPSPCGQRRRRTYPDNSYRLQADAIRGLQPRSDRSDYHGSVRTCHRRRRSRRMPALLPAGRVHPVCIAYGTCRLQAHQPSRVGRQRPPCAWKSPASTRTRVYHPNMPYLARTFCAHSRPIPRRDQRPL